MKIDILCRDGSPLGVTMKSLYGEDGRCGVGGAELALLTICEEWTKRGHEVTLYNDPKEDGASPFQQEWIKHFDPARDRDVLITFRSPNPKSIDAKGLKVWWSQDQQTTGDFAEFQRFVDKIVVISPFHAEYFKQRYKINKTILIDEPVRVEDYRTSQKKVPYRFIFCSVPERGLDILLNLWPEIKRNLPEASLHITSDYRLWGAAYPLNERYKIMAMGLEDVKFLGAIKRQELIKEQLISEILAYPCIYDELFCYAVAEAGLAGAYPITSTTGALRTTNMGIIIEGNVRSKAWTDEFLRMIFLFFKSPNVEQSRGIVRGRSFIRFSPETILKEWDEKVFK